jgi:thioredoxin-related protein
MKNLFQIPLFAALLFCLASFLGPEKEKIHWISLNELNKIYKEAPRPLLIDVYTDWCGWCKKMDKDTYRNDRLAGYVNDHFYAVKLNAEDKKTLNFNNSEFPYDHRNRANTLAIALLGNRLEFPTTVFMTSMDAQPAPLAGYLTAKDMEAPLKYFGEAANRKQSFVEFNQGFKGEW